MGLWSPSPRATPVTASENAGGKVDLFSSFSLYLLGLSTLLGLSRYWREALSVEISSLECKNCLEKENFQFQCIEFWPFHGTLGLHQVSERDHG